MKAQIWSFDYAVSMIIFLTALILVMFFWSYASVQSSEGVQLADLQDKSLAISDILLRSPGIPDPWTNQNVISPGLALSEKILDPAKLYEFTLLDYNRTRSLLGIGQYGFRLQVIHANGTVFTINNTAAEAGYLPNATSAVAPIERYALLNGEIVKVRLSLWSP